MTTEWSRLYTLIFEKVVKRKKKKYQNLLAFKFLLKIAFPVENDIEKVTKLMEINHFFLF